MYQTVNPPRLYMAWAGVGVEVAFRPSRRPGGHATFVLTARAQDMMFAGRMPRFAGTCRASFALWVRSNRLCSHVWRRMFSRAYT
jgi:hypothetical protein